MRYTAEQLKAIIREINTDLDVVQRAIAVTKRNQDAVNRSLYQGRIEAYESVIGLLKASKTNHEIDLRRMTK